MEINRDYYLQKLIDRKRNGQIKVITGVCRYGKSFLMNTLFYRHLLDCGIAEDHIILFAFDSAEGLLKIDEDPIEIQEQDRKVSPRKFMNHISSLIRDSVRLVYGIQNSFQIPPDKRVILTMRRPIAPETRSDFPSPDQPSLPDPYFVSKRGSTS